jgi:hypothetical protein
MHRTEVGNGVKRAGDEGQGVGSNAKYNNENMEIVSPPSIAAMSQIFANAELVSFTSSLGLVLK